MKFPQIKPPRIPILTPFVIVAGLGLLMSLDADRRLKDNLEDLIVGRKLPDAKLLNRTFSAPAIADVSDEWLKQRTILDTINGLHRSTGVVVLAREPDGGYRVAADNLKTVSHAVTPEMVRVGLETADRMEDDPDEYYKVRNGIRIDQNGNDLHLITAPFNYSRGETISTGRVVMITNVGAAVKKPSGVVHTVLIRIGVAFIAGSALFFAICVAPVIKLTRQLRRGQTTSVGWWVPKPINALAEQLTLDRAANERFRTEANEFRASIDLRSRVIEASPVPTFICKLPKSEKQAIITYANVAVSKQFGYDDPIGQPLNILVPPEYWGYHTWDTLYDEDLKRGVGMAGCPHVGASRVVGQQRPVPVLAQGGIKLQALLSVDRIADDEDGSRNFIGTLQDITPLIESREAETIARKKAEILAEEIESVNHIAVHDIKADLTAVGKGSEVIAETIEELIEYLTGNDDAVLLDAIDTIKFFSGLNVNSAKNAFEVLDQRNKLYDLESKIEIAPCSVSDILAALEAAFSSESGEFRATNDCPENRLILADYSLLLTVLKNIVRNGYVHNDSPLKRVEVRVAPIGQYSRITITDNGVGMPGTYLENWGKTMGKAAQLSGRGGSGTGLYSIRRIVDAHPNASIEVTSAVGQGTTFTLEFPHVA